MEKFRRGVDIGRSYTAISGRPPWGVENYGSINSLLFNDQLLELPVKNSNWQPLKAVGKISLLVRLVLPIRILWLIWLVEMISSRDETILNQMNISELNIRFAI